MINIEIDPSVVEHAESLKGETVSVKWSGLVQSGYEIKSVKRIGHIIQIRTVRINSTHPTAVFWVNQEGKGAAFVGSAVGMEIPILEELFKEALQ